MKPKVHLFSILIIWSFSLNSQTYPTFGPEKKVNISGLTLDAMEPFISADGNRLFFNSLNSGGNTNLYAASRLNDTSFTLLGPVGGTQDTSANHLDAVPSLDSANNFFWVSLRGYPGSLENLHRGKYSGANVTQLKRVYGNFNIYSFNSPFGWLIMDAAINYQGNLLYFCNAKFDFSNTSCVGIPCEAKLGVAQKINDSIFNRVPNSNALFSYVNDTLQYLVYAPQITKDGLELYYTRMQKGTPHTEICVSIRNSVTDTFSSPSVIQANLGFAPEAASPSLDKQKLYYHQKDANGHYRIYLRYREPTTGLSEHNRLNHFRVFPNPSTGLFTLSSDSQGLPYTLTVYSQIGTELLRTSDAQSIDLSPLPQGLYLLKLEQGGRIWTRKLFKE